MVDRTVVIATLNVGTMTGRGREVVDVMEQLRDVMLKIPDAEVTWVAGDFNGHVGEGSLDTEVTGKYGVGIRNEGVDKIVDFATAKSMAVVNTYFQKRLTRRATYTSGGQSTQVDYIMCKRRELKTIQDCYVLPKEAVAKQHKLVVCKVKMKQQIKRSECGTEKTRWWKLNEEEHQNKFVQEVERKLDKEERKEWSTLSGVVRETAVEVLGRTSGRKGKKEETWWWNTEVQDAIRAKREKKKERDLNRCEETIVAFKEANKKAKREVAKAKSKAYEELYSSLDGQDGQRKAIRIAKQKHKEAQDVY
ncbi:uncharacterized protein LOC125036999 [Penaeus chinensis]|uniref:uncharacterized protein LOC125036999 n=1 Tax=Penaeus chinensis TaxID=139456 RepID=UPI001FB595EE|nr:uncharacterized protein LOC125036999 [Penaeus chinensis]